MEKANKWIRLGIIVVAELLVFLVVLSFGLDVYYGWFAGAEGIQEECWVLCEPGSEVNLREVPKKHGAIFGAASCGTCMWTDQKERNGFVHVLELPAELDSGWISTRYIVYDEPRIVMAQGRIRAEGRVACRKWIGGKVIRWVYDGDELTVYAVTEEWSVTDHGYIRTEFIGEGSEWLSTSN